MRVVFLALGAQLAAEVRTRLRSAGTLAALAFILAGSTLWMPNPRGHAASLTWRVAGEVVYTPVYRVEYVGLATAILTAVFLLLVAFYLVAGSVRRDRDTNVGAILAATPLTKGSYLCGKLAANVAYLGLVSILILAVGVGKLLAFGEGPLAAAPLLLPWLFVCVPGGFFVSAMAVLFDVAPGLRGRAGLVISFFASMSLLLAVPMAASGGPDGSRVPVFDPIGLATLHSLIRGSLPPDAHAVSLGLMFTEKPLARVPWSGLRLSAGVAAWRLASVAWAVPPFVLALLLFDRFDPARRAFGRIGLRKRREAGSARESVAANDELLSLPLHVSKLPTASAKPGTGAAILAEARLVWDLAPVLRWALLAASVSAALLPGEAASFAAAAFLALLVPAISEAGAREALSGAEALVFSQPSVPRSPALWKAGSLAVFLLTLAAPLLLRAALTSAAHLFALVTGLLFVAAFASCAALLTGGGKLFSGLYLALWYAAANKLPPADFCGTFDAGLGLPVRVGYLLTGAAFLGLAVLTERWRRAGRR